MSNNPLTYVPHLQQLVSFDKTLAPIALEYLFHVNY